MKKYFVLIIVLLSQTLMVSAADFNGKFNGKLIPNTENHEKIIFKHSSSPSLGTDEKFDNSTHITSGRILNPAEGYSSKVMLVEEEGKAPYIFIDLDNNNRTSNNEKFILKQELANNPFLWNITVDMSSKGSLFSACPVFIRYFKSVRYEKMHETDRLITQSTEAFARGTVDVKGKNVLVQYEYDFSKKEIDPENGWLGVDADQDGEIDMDNLSPEAARANDEKIVFRIGDTYVSTKKADMKKNQIILREHQAKDYKRIELAVGKELPDFSFVDLSGGKRRLSEFRGKYVLLDFWGFWCPPCLVEMPYLREAYKRFKGRNFEIVGMNTDRRFTPESIKKNLAENNIYWTQGQRSSFEEMMDLELRIESFPTTFLLSPEGKIISMSRTEKDEPDLRGKDLLKTLDEILPE